jgi:crotonobetaine/carnitine-CoA ligase
VTTVHALLRAGARRYGQRPALLIDEAAVTYEDLLSRAEGLAGGFHSIGIAAADHVAIVMDTSFECVTAWLAVGVVGCTDVPINPQYRGDLLLYLLRDSEATVVVCDGVYLRQIADIAAQLPLLRYVVVNGHADIAPPPHVRLISFDACAQAKADVPMAVDAGERVILYTSGTTGPSKGVVHTQTSCLVLARYNAEMLAYDETDRLLNFFPLFHQNARYTGVMPALCVGASIRLERRFSSSAFWRICDKDGITAFNYLGSVLRLILNVTPPGRGVGTHSVRKAFGAGSPRFVWEQFERRLGIRLVEVYGLTEAPMAAVNTRQAGRQAPIGSAGCAGDLFEVAVVDAQDRVLRPGEVGEIVMRPKRPDAMMIGYYNKDAATVRAYRNLWFHSGDRGRLSAEGALYFEERSKDAVRRRGENVSAWEVESVLDQHPDVAESAVYGVASDEVDEEVAAALVLRRDGADLAAILRFAEERLPAYAVPTLFRVMKDLPRTPTAKVQKATLRSAGRAACFTRTDIMAG